MAEREIVLEQDEADVPDANVAMRQALERAEHAEAELARLKAQSAGSKDAPVATKGDATAPGSDGETELRKDSMMAHLLDSLTDGKDIGHYGRLVFAMVARHFMNDEEVLGWLTRDPDFGQEAATVMLRQVEGRDYNPPKRERILEWQAKQEFPIMPNPDDPDCGNLYRNLKFPDTIYHHIEKYQEQKVASE